MSLQEKLGHFTKRRRTDVMPGWSSELVDAVVEYYSQSPWNAEDLKQKKQQLWKTINECAQTPSDIQLAEGTRGVTVSVSNKVYKRLYSTLEWTDLVIEALKQAMIHRAVPFATPNACVCKKDKKLYLVTEKLDKTLADAKTTLEKLDAMAQVTVIYLALEESPEIQRFAHLDLHEKNIMCTFSETPVSYTVGGISYTSPTHAKWQLIDWGDGLLETETIKLGNDTISPVQDLINFYEFAFPELAEKLSGKILAVMTDEKQSNKVRMINLLKQIQRMIDATLFKQ